MQKNHKQKIQSVFAGINRDLLASRLKSSRRTIDQYANGLLSPSPSRALEIERITKGKVPASVLRPDIFGGGRKVKGK